MTAEELKALLAESLKPFAERLDKMEQDNKKIVEHVEANATVRAMVEPHATSLEAANAAMSAAGIGTDARYGHAVVLQRMADSMRAEAALGRVPSAFHDSSYYASSAQGNPTNEEDIDVKPEELKTLVASSVKDAVDAAVKPLQDQLAAANEKLTTTETKLKDLETLRRTEASGPQRKTLPPTVTHLMARANLAMPEGEGKLTIGAVDTALKACGNLTMQQRIMLKNELDRAGVLVAA